MDTFASTLAHSTPRTVTRVARLDRLPDAPAAVELADTLAAVFGDLTGHLPDRYRLIHDGCAHILAAPAA